MIVQIVFTGEQESFAKRATEGANRSEFARTAFLRACAATLGEDPPEAPAKAALRGSRNPEARALGLATSEYKRRLGVLARAGVESPTVEQVQGVPPAKRLGGKVA